jgi:hypothetical protein
MTKRLIVAGFLVGAVLFALSGCAYLGSAKEAKQAKETPQPQKAQQAEQIQQPKEAKETEPAKGSKSILRVNCGLLEPYTDKSGNVWLADQEIAAGKEWGAVGGQTVDRGDLAMAGTNSPRVYETERYSMDGYKFSVPNGKYTVRLHFAETYSGIVNQGERVFSVSVNGKGTLTDFDPFKDAGGFQKPVVKTIEGVTVTNGELVIGFTTNIQNPEINGIEIVSE